MKSVFKKIIVSIITWQARLVLARYKPKIVAVTGSVGKTSTKDAMYAVLSERFVVRRSEKSFNSEIGVPLTILGCANGWNNPFIWMENILHGFSLILFKHPYPEWLVLEVGADRPHDIRTITSWLRPDVSVMIAIGETPVHVEFFPSIEDLVKEKSYLAQALKQKGTLILNQDDPKVAVFAEYAVKKSARIFSVSTHDVDMSDDTAHRVSAYGYEIIGGERPTGIRFKVRYRGEEVIVVRNGLLGVHLMYPALYACALGISVGIPLATSAERLSENTHTPGRMSIIRGMNDTTLIDDTYNASPGAMREALATLQSIPAKRKIAILGDMLELGKYSVPEHKKVGELIASLVSTADARNSLILMTVGLRAHGIARSARAGGVPNDSVFEFESSDDCATFLQSSFSLQLGDVVLVKGSQSIRMERIVEKLMLEPEKKKQLLVRQEEEWQRR